MKQADQHFRLRIPSHLKEQVENLAAFNHRSINAEIIARLEQSLSGESLSETLKQALREVLDERG